MRKKHDKIWICDQIKGSSFIKKVIREKYFVAWINFWNLSHFHTKRFQENVQENVIFIKIQSSITQEFSQPLWKAGKKATLRRKVDNGFYWKKCTYHSRHTDTFDIKKFIPLYNHPQGCRGLKEAKVQKKCYIWLMQCYTQPDLEKRM